jgi:lipopolysaccharide export system permease protein
MKRLDSHVGVTVLMASLLVWLAVASLETLFVFLGEIDDVGRGAYTLGDALRFALLTLPMRAWQSLAVSTLIGALLGLGALAARGELTAFGLAGCSPARLARAAVQAGALLVAFAALIGEGWGPSTQHLGRQLRSAAMFDAVDVRGEPGFWLRDGNRLVQVGHSNSDGSLSAVHVYELDATPRLVAATSAARAYPLGDGRWVLERLASSLFGHGEVKVQLAERAQWPALVDPRLADILSRDPQTLSLPNLTRYMAYLERSGGSAADYRSSFWRRVAEPFTALSMLMLAVGMMLGSLARRSAGQRVLIAVLAGLAFKLGNEIVVHAGQVYGVAPWLAALLPALIALLLAGWLLRGPASVNRS